MKLIVQDGRVAATVDDSYLGPDAWVPAPEGFTADLAAYAVIVDDALDLKATLWQKIKATRDRRKSEGGYIVGGKWFHSDADSKTQQLGLMTLILLGQTLPGTPWKTMDGSYVPMTNALATQVFAAAVALDTNIFPHAEALRAAVNAAADPLAVDLGGWPQAFYDL